MMFLHKYPKTEYLILSIFRQTPIFDFLLLYGKREAVVMTLYNTNYDIITIYIQNIIAICSDIGG